MAKDLLIQIVKARQTSLRLCIAGRCRYQVVVQRRYGTPRELAVGTKVGRELFRSKSCYGVVTLRRNATVACSTGGGIS
jgi:hypothetical protein